MSLVRLACVAAIAITPAAPAVAQARTADENAALAVVERMFTGMRTGDSAVVRAVFAPGARFAGVDPRATPPAVRYDSVGGWITGIARSNGRWDERIYDVATRADGGIAVVWAPYTFYLDKKVSHCGVNVIDMLRIGDEWKVIQIYDSRRRESCPDPLASGGRSP